jgi:hypothetical protein
MTSNITEYLHEFHPSNIPFEINFRDLTDSINPMVITFSGGTIYTDPIPEELGRPWLGLYCTKKPLNSANIGGILYPIPPTFDTEYVLYFFDVAKITKYGDTFNYYEFPIGERISFNLAADESSVFFMFSSPDFVGDISNEGDFISFFKFTIVDNVQTYGLALQAIVGEETKDEEILQALENIAGTTGDRQFGYVIPNS